MLAKFSGLTTAKKCTKKRDAREKLLVFFCQSKPIVCFLFAVEVQKLPVVVIQKFCYHGDVTSHFSSLLLIYNSSLLQFNMCKFLEVNLTPVIEKFLNSQKKKHRCCSASRFV